jgi:hypothetical protein
MPQVDLAADGSVVRDAQGIALGGIRTPQVDVPVAALSGVGQTGTTFCGLFGTTVPFASAQLQAVHTSHEQFVTAWTESLDSAVGSGAVQPADAANLRTVVQQSSVLR